MADLSLELTGAEARRYEVIRQLKEARRKKGMVGHHAEAIDAAELAAIPDEPDPAPQPETPPVIATVAEPAAAPPVAKGLPRSLAEAVDAGRRIAARGDTPVKGSIAEELGISPGAAMQRIWAIKKADPSLWPWGGRKRGATPSAPKAMPKPSPRPNASPAALVAASEAFAPESAPVEPPAPAAPDDLSLMLALAHQLHGIPPARRRRVVESLAKMVALIDEREGR
jgi:hypothetical protein